MSLDSDYNKHGYILIKKLFDAKTMDNIVNEAKEIFKIQMLHKGYIKTKDISNYEFEQALYKLFANDLQQIIYCGKQLQHMIPLHKIALDEKITDRLIELGLSFPILNIRPVIFFNNAKLGKKDVDWKKPSHQDWRTTQGSIDSIVVWIPLVDTPKELGALEIMPGSHKMGLINHDLNDDYLELTHLDDTDFISVEVEKGDALFFSTLLVHRSGVNVTDKIRWSCHFRYNNINDQSFIDRGFPHTYFYGPQKELVTANFPTEKDAKTFFEKN